MRKYIAILGLFCTVLCIGKENVPAAETGKAMSVHSKYNFVPYTDYISSADVDLQIYKNGTAIVSGEARGYQGTTTRVEIKANLQQYKGGQWVTIKTFNAESDSHRVSLSETYSVSKGYTYRVKALVKAYAGSSSETKSVTSNEVTY